MQITTCLWFNYNGREAAEYYVNIFPESKLKSDWVTPVETPGNAPDTEVTIEFEIFGQNFLALNGGPNFKFSEATSFIIPCKDQSEIDHYWNTLINDGGQASQCGWLKDKFGVSWQITSPKMQDYLGGPDAEGRSRAVEAMLGQTKIDLGELKDAYEGSV